MDLENCNGFSLRGLARINVLLGKNGCGKSFLLRRVEQGLTGREGIGKVRYISPERGGLLSYEPGVEQSMVQSPTWLSDTRRSNQSAGFRQQSAALFRRLELLFLREIEREHTQDGYQPRSFDQTVEQLNTLLDRVRLKRHDQQAFLIEERESGNLARPEDISSGEAEIISLGVEFIAFVKEAESGKDNFLLVDSPDVHLHPDLQDRLARFIVNVLEGTPVTLVLATHSTAMLAALSDKTDTCVAFMRSGDQEISCKAVTNVLQSILPIFGAHPLSNVFNQTPILLIEGEDDERIWQQAVRSSEGCVRVYPCVVDGVDRFAQHETEVSNVIEAVYDNARGYSLRDRDLHPELIENFGPVIRMRLSCRSAENLMLSDDALELAQTDWPTFQRSVEAWVASNREHQYFGEVQAFVESDFNRKDHDLKAIRNILIGLMSNKPWEVLVGQAIAQLSTDRGPSSPGSLRDFLGEKVCQELLKLDLA